MILGPEVLGHGVLGPGVLGACGLRFEGLRIWLSEFGSQDFDLGVWVWVSEFVSLGLCLSIWISWFWWQDLDFWIWASGFRVLPRVQSVHIKHWDRKGVCILPSVHYRCICVLHRVQ